MRTILRCNLALILLVLVLALGRGSPGEAQPRPTGKKGAAGTSVESDVVYGHKAGLALTGGRGARPAGGQADQAAAEVKNDVLEFFRGRFVNLLADRFPADAVDALAPQRRWTLEIEPAVRDLLATALSAGPDWSGAFYGPGGTRLSW